MTTFQLFIKCSFDKSLVKISAFQKNSRTRLKKQHYSSTFPVTNQEIHRIPEVLVNLVKEVKKGAYTIRCSGKIVDHNHEITSSVKSQISAKK